MREAFGWAIWWAVWGPVLVGVLVVGFIVFAAVECHAQTCTPPAVCAAGADINAAADGLCRLALILPEGSEVRFFKRTEWSRAEAWTQVPQDEDRNHWRKAHTRHYWCWYREAKCSNDF